MAFIDLGRRFAKLTQKELEDPDYLALFSGRAERGYDWARVEKFRRVLLLAEAGSGKTEEMRARAAALREKNTPAFFLPLEALDKYGLTELLDPPEHALFESWRAQSGPAWFFLDAVDELKLINGKLEQSLRSLAKAVDGRLSDIHVVLSCRPYDWRPKADLEIYGRLLPIPPQEKIAADADAAFESTLTRSKKIADALLSDTAIQLIALLPFSNRQIERFAEHLGVNDPKAFMTEIGRQDAWSFARRPLDLIELANIWSQSGKLGTRREQHEANIKFKLTDDCDRPDANVLDDGKARAGAEQLALALTLSRTRTLRSPEQGLDGSYRDGVLDPAEILRAKWSAGERAALLRRALFDPANYGRTRFHHRSVQEYLAAQRLWKMRQAGMSTDALHRLLFAERYGELVVLPSMREIAAWLALEDETVRQMLIAREPEALLSLGDPESLNMAVRKELILSFAKKYGTGGWSGVSVPQDELRRLAHPDLGPVIRNLWSTTRRQVDVGGLLLELIWQGAIVSCADLARETALDHSAPYHHRIFAIRALLACKDIATAREVTEQLLAAPLAWDRKVVHAAISDLFPATLTVSQLISLLQHVPEDTDSAGGFSWSMKLIADKIDPLSQIAIELRDALVEAVWEQRPPRQEHYAIVPGPLGYLCGALAILCERQFASGAPLDERWPRASVIASRFAAHDNVSAHSAAQALRATIASHPDLRPILLWTEMAVMQSLCPQTEPAMLWHQVSFEGLGTDVDQGDAGWLLASAADAQHPDRRALALEALIELHWHDQKSGLDTRIMHSVAGDLALTTRAQAALSPAPPDPRMEEHNRKYQEHRIATQAREAKRLENWKAWRYDVLADPDVAFAGTRAEATLWDMYQWERNAGDHHSRYDIWNLQAVADAFTPGIAACAQTALSVLWRDVMPALWSERPADERLRMPRKWILGLCGVALEAKAANWAASLSDDEVKRAVRYAALEMNGLSPFIMALAAQKPKAVQEVLCTELGKQLDEAASQMHLPLLQDLGHADQTLKRLVVGILLDKLAAWPTSGDANLGIHLETALRIVADVSGDAAIDAAKICAGEFAKQTTLSQVWLKALFRFDPIMASGLLHATLSACAPEDPKALALLAGIFGQFDGFGMNMANEDARARALANLVREAYRLAPVAGDNHRTGVHEADLRDQATRAREGLLAQLLNTSGAVAQAEIRAIAAQPSFAGLQQRFLLLARRRAAAECEFAALSAEQIRMLEERYEAPPRDRDGLFAVMMDRLKDLQYQIAEDDFSDRKTLALITEETDMQKTLALRLKQAANGVYQISRENEVINAKRTDLHFAAVMGDCKGAVEIKLADKQWTVADLEGAISDQLIGQYLRDANRKAGILLLTFAGGRNFWHHPQTGAKMTFDEVVAHLRDFAAQCEQSYSPSIRVAVAVLDLRA